MRRTGKQANQPAGFAPEDSSGLDFGFFVFVLFSRNSSDVFEPIAPASDGDGPGTLRETTQDGASRGSFFQQFVQNHDSDNESNRNKFKLSFAHRVNIGPAKCKNEVKG
jgi:hypothetical protein